MTSGIPLIGRTVEVTGHSNPCTEGKSGEVTAETKNTFTVEGAVVPKKTATIEMEGRMLEGKEAIGKPEERI